MTITDEDGPPGPRRGGAAMVLAVIWAGAALSALAATAAPPPRTVSAVVLALFAAAFAGMRSACDAAIVALLLCALHGATLGLGLPFTLAGEHAFAFRPAVILAALATAVFTLQPGKSLRRAPALSPLARTLVQTAAAGVAIFIPACLLLGAEFSIDTEGARRTVQNLFLAIAAPLSLGAIWPNRSARRVLCVALGVTLVGLIVRN